MLDTICDVLKAAYNRNWISTRDGNASFRRQNENFIYVTPSGVRKQHLNAEMIIKMQMDDNIHNTHEPWNYLYRVQDDYQDKIIGLQPTGELPLHILLQQKIPENRVVLHLHPTYIIAAMYSGINLQDLANDFPEINRYTRVGPNLPVIPPISKELAIETVKAFNLDQDTGNVDYDIIGLDRHGIIAIGKDAWNAYEHVERLEHICQIALAARTFNPI
jgi:ribulose-5-phosphate 4-epimerase/fuculose-1-phosphate aldolase